MAKPDGWQIGDPLTPSMVAKAQKTRETKANRKKAKSVSAHVRRMLQLQPGEFREELPKTMAEMVARALIGGATTANKDHISYTREVLDRSEGKARQTVDQVEPSEARALIRNSLSGEEVETMEISLRENGFDSAADELVRDANERRDQDAGSDD